MTKEKIKLLLTEKYGISNPFGKWIRLPHLSSIFLDQDANLYLDKNSLYYFSEENELLYVSTNYVYPLLSSDKLGNDLSDHKYNAVFTFKSIMGFNSTSILGPYGTQINRIF